MEFSFEGNNENITDEQKCLRTTAKALNKGFSFDSEDIDLSFPEVYWAAYSHLIYRSGMDEHTKFFKCKPIVEDAEKIILRYDWHIDDEITIRISGQFLAGQEKLFQEESGKFIIVKPGDDRYEKAYNILARELDNDDNLAILYF